MEIHTIGIDLGKTLFHLVGVDASGAVVVRKRCSRKQLLAYTANVRVQVIGMEACSGPHFLGRALRQQGHDVRLMPAQYVKPSVKANKNDYIDAEAIAEAVVGRRCALCRSRATTSWICSLCTGCRSVGSGVARPWLIRFEACYWSGALRCERAVSIWWQYCLGYLRIRTYICQDCCACCWRSCSAR